MNPIGEKGWLSALPMVGYDVNVFLKTGQKIRISLARLSTDGQMVHVGIIQEPADKDSSPIIYQTLQIPETDIRKIFLKYDKFHTEILRFEKPDIPESAQPPAKYPETEWLRDLPKSRKCHIFLLCKNRDDCKEIYRGWVEYDGRKIYLTEITLEAKVVETDRHERHLNDVIAVLITVDGQSAQIFARTAKTELRY